MKNYVSTTTESLPMFKSKFLDFFSRSYWFIPLVVYLPIIGVLVFYFFFKFQVSGVLFLFLFFAGFLFWTFVEYIMHRFFFHFHASSQAGKRFFWIVHGVHHDYPNDRYRLVMPLSVSTPLAFFFCFSFYLILGMGYSLGFAVGFLLGYLIYDMSHYAIHHFPMHNSFFKRIKSHHMLHHYQFPDKGFGVTFTLWDIVFSTMFNHNKPSNTKQEKDSRNN